MSTRALTGNRLMNLPVPASNIAYTDADGWTADNGWEVDSPNATIYYENYFDLSGYELDDLTLYPVGISLQDGLPYFTSNGADPSLLVYVLDIVSQERLNMSTIRTLIANLGYPSSPESNYDWTQILFCQIRGFTALTNIGNTTIMQPVSVGEMGSAEPTSVQKLWCYRVVLPGGTDWSDQTVTIPATRFVLAGNIAKEADLEYIMRQKRSYELATQG